VDLEAQNHVEDVL